MSFYREPHLYWFRGHDFAVVMELEHPPRRGVNEIFRVDSFVKPGSTPAQIRMQVMLAYKELLHMYFKSKLDSPQEIESDG